MWQETPYTIPLIVIAAFSIMVGIYIRGYRRSPLGKIGAVIILANSEWIVTHALELASADLPSKIFWDKMQFLGIVIVPTGWVVYALYYSGHEKWLTRRTMVLLALMPLITLLLVFTSEYHDLIWTTYILDADGPFSVLYNSYGLWLWSYIGYMYVLGLFVSFLFIKMFIHSQSIYRWQIGALMLSALVPWVASAVVAFDLNPFPHLEMTPVFFAVAIMVVAFGRSHLHLENIVPLARETIIEHLSDSIIVLDTENCIVDVNLSAQHLFERVTAEIIGKSLKAVWPEGWFQISTDLTTAKEIVLNYGQRIYDVRISPLTDWRGSTAGTAIVLRDVTERKRAEELLHESEKKFRTIFEHASDEIVYLDTSGTIIDINKRSEELLGYRREELIGKNFADIKSLGKEYRTYVLELFENMIMQGRPLPEMLIELELTHKDGHKIFVEVSSEVIKKNGKVEGVLSILRDITERKRAEEKIRQSLKEKEVLLKEIHHRVKNNMQIISSLLNLQSHYSTDKPYVEMLKESQDRIKSMALIHEKLYQSENLAEIDFKEYIKTLVYGLVRSYNVNTGGVSVTLDVKDIYLDIDIAIPCGLIINELVSNSLKHAFPHGNGELTVSFHGVNGAITLIVKDNGVGIPDTIDFKHTQSLGLHLVTILTEDQLEGEITLDRTKGTTFCITFNKKSP